MKNIFILFMLIALSSCSSFDRMKYGHLKKVPATPPVFQATETVLPVSVSDPEIIERVNVIQDQVPIISTRYDTTATSSDELISLPASVEERMSIASGVEQQIASISLSPIKRDWSLLIGSLLVIGGLILLSLCIFYYPSAGISFLWLIAFEIATLYAAWRMIGTGVMYFVTRFRRKKNFSER